MSDQDFNASSTDPDQPMPAPDGDSRTDSISDTPASEPAPGDTVGTGSVLALGCIGGTLFLIVLGLVYIVVVQIFG